MLRKKKQDYMIFIARDRDIHHSQYKSVSRSKYTGDSVKQA